MMALLTRSQRVFGSELARQLGAGARTELIGGWLFNEMNGGAAATREANRDYNWLNIGWTDSGQRGTGNRVWRDPVSAARHTARWLRGEWEVPGFGRAAPGIQKFAQTVAQGKSLDAQMAALRNSGWASSGYPDLPGIVQQYGGKFGLSAPGGQVRGGGGGMRQAAPQSTTVQGRPRVELAGGDGGAGLLDMLQGRLQSGPQRPQVPSAGLATPGFAAGPRLPAGYQSLLGGAGPGGAPRQAGLEDALRSISQLQGVESTVRPVEIRVPGGTRRAAAPGGRHVPAESAGQAATALAWAARRLGIAETVDNGGGRGGRIDRWQSSLGFSREEWCGIFVGVALREAGVRGIDGRVAGTINIPELARRGEGGFERLVGYREVRPGDVVVWNPGPQGHTGLVEQVNRDGTITTIEGNSGKAVRRNVHPKQQGGVYYARPRWAA